MGPRLAARPGRPGRRRPVGPRHPIPALIVAPDLKGEFLVDSTQYDTTSILATIERRYGLAPLGTRDAAVNDLSSVFDAKEAHSHKEEIRGRKEEVHGHK